MLLPGELGQNIELRFFFLVFIGNTGWGYIERDPFTSKRTTGTDKGSDNNVGSDSNVTF